MEYYLPKGDKMAAAQQASYANEGKYLLAWLQRWQVKLEACFMDWQRGLFTLEQLAKATGFYGGIIAKYSLRLQALALMQAEPKQIFDDTVCPECGSRVVLYSEPCQCELAPQIYVSRRSITKAAEKYDIPF